MTSAQTAWVLLDIALILVLARLLGWLFRKIGQPAVIGEVIAGILLGPTLFNGWISTHLVPVDVRGFLNALASIGLVLFMFIVGFELDTSLIRGKGRIAASVSTGSILLPFGLGILLAFWLYTSHPTGAGQLAFALFIGAAMSVTAFPVLARILTDRGMHRTQLGGLALASAAVDDIMAWSILAVVVAIAAAGASAGHGASWQILFAIPYLVVMFAVVRPLLKRLVDMRDKAGRLTPSILAIVLTGVMLSAWATEWMGIHFIFGAFLFGVVMPRAGVEKMRHEILERLEQVSVLLLLPLFFINAGLKVDLSKVGLDGLVELLAILAVAIGGKFIGAYIGARLNKVRNQQAAALATLMNTRGLTELIILTVGVQLMVLDTKLYSLMVVMAVVTTVMTGPLLKWIYPDRRIAKDVAEAEAAALGVTAAHRVLTLIPDPSDGTARTDLATDLAGGRRPAEVVLTHIKRYATPNLEVGSGLSGELAEMAGTMGELEGLARHAKQRGLDAPVLSRFSDDPIREVAEQVAAATPQAVLVARSDDGYEQISAATTGQLLTLLDTPPTGGPVVVLGASGRNAESAIEAGAAIASARGVELLLAESGKPSRKSTQLAATLTTNGLPTRAVSMLEVPTEPAPMMVATDDGNPPAPGVHLLVRPAQDPDEPNWPEVIGTPATVPTA
ncbi:cation:proton antiporter [Fodinicola acaciae]|uniref:cation:proton antiporter domain-containing protein n=1 Tax=Fodinicola acaciae TaxID=2681555 RepID=UPI0013D8C773|nr:cation:proton antiporter [Fodinicola acaciae]